MAIRKRSLNNINRIGIVRYTINFLLMLAHKFLFDTRRNVRLFVMYIKRAHL